MAAVDAALVDLAEYALPVLAEPRPATDGEYEHAHPHAWAETTAAHDAFVFVTPDRLIPGMRRTDRLAIRDPRAGAVLASGWTLDSRAAQEAAAQASLLAMPARTGLLRYSVFRGIEDLTLLHLSQWADEPARDVFVADSSGPRTTVDSAVPAIRRDWREPAAPYRSIVLDAAGDATCLVAVRQPLELPDPAVQRAWVDAVIDALTSDATPQPGLLAATFFASADEATVLNLAEWADADAHRAALRPADFGQGGQPRPHPRLACRARGPRYQPGARRPPIRARRGRRARGQPVGPELG